VPFVLGAALDFRLVFDLVLSALLFLVRFFDLLILGDVAFKVFDKLVKLRDNQVMSLFDFLVRHSKVDALLTELPRQLLQVMPLFVVAKSYGDSVGACSCRTTDSVKIALRLNRETEVDDSFDGRDIESTSHKISSEQEVSLTFLELLDSLHTLQLAHVAVHLHCLVSVDGKHDEGSLTLLLLVEEHDRSLVERLLDQLKQGGFSSNQEWVIDFMRLFFI